MSKSQLNLQDSFLNQVRKENIPVTNTVSGTATVVGCQTGHSSTDDTLTFARHYKLHIHVEAAFLTRRMN